MTKKRRAVSVILSGAPPGRLRTHMHAKAHFGTREIGACIDYAKGFAFCSAGAECVKI